MFVVNQHSTNNFIYFLMCSNKFCVWITNGLLCRRSCSILQIWVYHRWEFRKLFATAFHYAPWRHSLICMPTLCLLEAAHCFLVSEREWMLKCEAERQIIWMFELRCQQSEFLTFSSNVWVYNKLSIQQTSVWRGQVMSVAQIII
jgi:hypothetical protein